MELKPIILVDDDADDLELFGMAFKQLLLDNELLTFNSAREALDFLKKDNQQFLFILCDINMPKINGFELRNKIQTNEQLHVKCIPYLYFTTNANNIFQRFKGVGTTVKCPVKCDA